MEDKQILQHIVNQVEIEILNYKSDYVGIKKAKANGYYYVGDTIHITYEGGSTGKSLKEVKLLTRSLSQLTEEIEHNGERFVPEWILDELNSDIDSASYLNTSENRVYFEEFRTKHRKHHLDFMPYGMIQQLFEWHFDVFGLIEKGLAIKKGN